MLSNLVSPIIHKFSILPFYFKALALLIGAFILIGAWPLAVAALFGMIVFSTIQKPSTRFALAAVMLVPALVMEGFWVSSILAGINATAPKASATPSQVAITDHQNQIQGAKSEQSNQVRVVRAVSGDTIDVDQRGEEFRIRFVGIAAPRPGEGANRSQCFGDESKLFLHSLLENRMIEVITDSVAGERDSEGNVLRYVRMADGTKVNELMLEAGLARVNEAMEFEQKDIYVELAASADQHNKGLWASCADDGQPKITPLPSIVVTPTPRIAGPEPTGVPLVTPRN